MVGNLLNFGLMKKRPFILFATALLFILIIQHNTFQKHAIKTQASQSNSTKYQTLLPRPTTTNTINTLPSIATIPKIKKENKIDELFNQFDPEILEKYQGSGTGDEFFSADTNETLSISTSWFIWNANIPKAKLKFQKDPETGNYELNGGEIISPKNRISISHEQDTETNEKRTFLNFKKQF